MKRILYLTRVDRISLIMEIKKYISDSMKACEIFVMTDNEFCPSKIYADGFVLIPRNSSDVNIAEYIKSIISKHSINAIVVQSNYDMAYLLQIENFLKNTGVVYFAPTIQTFNICAYKSSLYSFLQEKDILTPAVYNYAELNNHNFSTPVVIKPNFGEGSQNVHIVNDFEELNFFYKRIESPIIQKYVEGEHYTVDCFNDLEHRLKVSTPRQRIVVQGSGSSVSRVAYDSKITQIAISLSAQLKISGVWNFQLVKSQEGLFVYDVNIKPAGGLIYSILSGIPYHKYIVDTLLRYNINEINYNHRANENIISAYRIYSVVN